MKRTYTSEEALKASLDFFKGDDLAADVFVSKYALRDKDKNLLEKSPEDMHKRLAKEFARIEQQYTNPLSEQEIFDLLKDWTVVPQGSPMSSIGNEFQIQSLSNCFVVESPEDSYGGIMLTDQEQAQIMKRRGGVGFDISTIRPKGMKTSNAAKTTDGIGVFMERFSNTCREVAQGGRRGALMLSLNVHHPEVRTFINIKKNLTKVTGANISLRLTDEFMQAVSRGENVQLRFPVEKNAEHSVSEFVDAKQLWDEIIEAAWLSAEPGLLFWDTVINRSPADAYSDLGFKTISTNPCITGETRVAVADGRGFVTIKQLADEEKDVPVYCYEQSTGKMIIQKMRNPRLTGKSMPVFNVTIEGGHSFKATGNHLMLLCDGTQKRVDALNVGDQLMISKRVERTLVEMNAKTRSTNPNHYVMIENKNGSKCEHRLIWQFHNGKIPSKNVIHHINFNSKDNAIDNLQCMTHEEHKNLHAEKMSGANNPIFRIKANPIRFLEYRKTLSNSLSGLNNPRAYDIDQEVFLSHVKSLTKNLGRRITRLEWQLFAKQNSLPVWPNSWRGGGVSFYELTVNIAKEFGFQHVNADSRLLRTLSLATSQGYIADIDNRGVTINRTCEWCNNEFVTPYSRREVAFCSHSCSNLYANRKLHKNVKRTKSLQDVHAQKATITRKAILDCFTELRFKLNRNPLQNEVISLCRERKIPYRTGTKYGFKNWLDVVSAASLHNHRVISVEYAGLEDVYNGTVDFEHNFCIGGFDIGNNESLMISTMNCGELPLSSYDSCRLTLVNLNNFVCNRFLPNASFDKTKFAEVVQKAQRLMDDIVDLENEKVNTIIDKIKADPEKETTKAIEIDLWKKIKQNLLNGRRTGLGITGLGDMLAGLNITYGSDEAIKMTEEVYKLLAVNAWYSSVMLASERGAFPVFSSERETNHDFINQVLDAGEDLNLRALHEKYGRRNIALLTTAPAGSVSTLTQTTSGCEPAFMLSYKRRKKINPNNDQTRVDFVDQLGDKWQEFLVYHHGYKQWIDQFGEDNVDKSPYANATSADINWVKKIDMQGVAQKWICHAISNTCNLPATATKEDVAAVYMRGWATGCKGVTIYRDGSRSGVLVSAETQDLKQPGNIQETHAPKRPKKLKCDVHRANIKGESYLILVGLLNDKPYELFCGLSQHIEVPKKFKNGDIIKNGKKDGVSTYNLSIPLSESDDDVLLFKDIVNLFDNPLYGSLTRTISLALRHGVPVSYLVEQLRKDKTSDVTSFSNVIARVLSKAYVVDGTAVQSEKKCESCGSNNLSYQQGCVTCVNCGNSKCS